MTRLIIFGKRVIQEMFTINLFVFRAMRFFMMFNRGHEMKLELVSETLSRQTFHFLQQQIDNYRDNFEHEKRNRPKYLMWGRRMHLCIRYLRVQL